MNYSEHAQLQLKEFKLAHPETPICGFGAQVWMDGIQVLGIQTITLEIQPDGSTLFLRTLHLKDDPGQTIIQTRLTSNQTSRVKVKLANGLVFTALITSSKFHIQYDDVVTLTLYSSVKDVVWGTQS